MTKDLKFLIRVVKKASKLITNKMVVNAKDDKGDLVTNFDLEIERFITDKIKKNYPDFDIVSEEFNSKSKLTKNCFTIDPIDGTINFANGLPLWGIQVACIKGGETCAAVIYCPALKELFYADEEGAFMNRKKLNFIANNSKLFVIESPDRLTICQNLLKTSPLNRQRAFYSSCIDFAWTACGRLSGVMFGYNSAWDYVPGMYICKQAGAYVYDKQNCHIAANSQEFLSLLKEHAVLDEKSKQQPKSSTKKAAKTK